VSRIRRILVPIDFSETSDAALAYARTLADSLGASLHVVHVFNDMYGEAIAADVSGVVYESMRASAAKATKRDLFKRMPPADRKRFRGTTTMVTGIPAEAIVDCAASRAMDLIVMGTHGRRGFAHVLLGSVAEQVVRTAPCPVLTVRAVRTEPTLVEDEQLVAAIA
jgi:nucleotide-binding universal stress UspA family protein